MASTDKKHLDLERVLENVSNKNTLIELWITILMTQMLSLSLLLK